MTQMAAAAQVSAMMYSPYYSSYDPLMASGYGSYGASMYAPGLYPPAYASYPGSFPGSYGGFSSLSRAKAMTDAGSPAMPGLMY